jgi:argininosuccinate lyase
MMPQKLNPTSPSSPRGKAGTAIGRLTGLLATVKGLPLAYDRDLQEDKPPVFARGATSPARSARSPCSCAGSRFDRERLAAACADPLLRATDAAEALVREGVPFRDAHEQVPRRSERARSSRRRRAAPRRRPRGGRGREEAVVVSAARRLARRPRPAADRRPRRRRGRRDPRPAPS